MFVCEKKSGSKEMKVQKGKNKSEIRRKRENKLVEQMIKIYCNGNHRNRQVYINGIKLCKSCHDLREYAFYKVEKCIMGDDKEFCSSCKIHCYSKEYKEKIKKVMKYSGRRMIIYHPLVAIRHILVELRDKRKKEVKNIYD